MLTRLEGYHSCDKKSLYFDKQIKKLLLATYSGRRDGLIVSALDSGSSSPGSRPGQGHCVVFLGKIDT